MSIHRLLKWEATAPPQNHVLQATDEECQHIAELYSIPAVHSVHVALHVAQLVPMAAKQKLSRTSAELSRTSASASFAPQGKTAPSKRPAKDMRRQNPPHGMPNGFLLTSTIKASVSLTCMRNLTLFRTRLTDVFTLHVVAYREDMTLDMYTEAVDAPDVAAFAVRQRSLQYDVADYIGESVALLIPSHAFAPQEEGKQKEATP